MYALTSKQFEFLLAAAHGGHEWLGPALALFGTSLTVVVGFVTVIVNKRSKEQEMLVNALEFLGGGIQKRAVGIAVSEHYAELTGKRELIENVLKAQKQHIVNSRYANSPVEIDNLNHINRIIDKWEARRMRPWGGVVRGYH